MTPAHVPPGPLIVDVLELVLVLPGVFSAVEDATEAVVLRLPAIREIDGPTSTNGLAFAVPSDTESGAGTGNGWRWFAQSSG